MHDTGFNHFSGCLFACKKMYRLKPRPQPPAMLLAHFCSSIRFLDVCDFVAETTTINFTGLETEALLRIPGQVNGSTSSSWNPLDYICPKIHKLNLTLRLPLPFYKALEEAETLGEAATRATSSSSSEARKTWADMWRAISHLQRLRSLSIWLDHEDKSS